MNQNQPAITITESRVKGVRVYNLRNIVDTERGNLTVGEFGSEFPFIPERYFLTYQIPSQTTRGEHAHRHCHQFLISVRGSCAVMVDDSTECQEFLLDHPAVGIYIPPMVWITGYKHSHDSTLMVFASHTYDESDYIRDYDEFLRELKDANPASEG